jgi:hypothetical protein
MIEKRDYTPRVLHVEAAGHEFEMARLSASDWVRLRRGDLDDGELVAAALDAIKDSSLPDGAELDMSEGLELMSAWVKAHKDDAVPPA